MKRKITLYTKRTGCMQCEMTKKALTRAGIIDRVKVIEIDQPENAGLLENLKAEGLLQAPIIMLNFPITHSGEQITEWAGFMPTAITALTQHLQEENN